MTQAPECPVNDSFDPLAPDFLADPYPVLAALPRAEQPVFFAPSIGYYVLTRYADIEAVFADPVTYSAAVAQAPLVPLVPEAQRILLAGGHKPQPSMVSLDEPEHARLRKPAARAFSMKRVNALVPVIEATTARLLDAVGPVDEFDLVAALAFPLPANIVFSLMGVPERDFAQLKYWSGYRAALGWGRPDPDDQVEIASGMADYRAYLRQLVDAKAADPGDDLTSDLAAIHREDPGRLSLEEIASILFSLSFAGHETTTGLIGNTVRRLLEARNPGPPSSPAPVSSRPRWRRPCATTRPCPSGGGSPPGRSPSRAWGCPPERNCSCGWRPRAATPPPSPSRTCSTCAGPTPPATWPSARACTTAWAPTWGSWRPSSRWPP
jgi:cytochrome P450